MKITEFGPDGIPARDTTTVGGTVVGAGSGTAGEVPIANGDGTAAWADLPPSGVTVKDEGTPLATAAASLDFVGAGVTASGGGAVKTITIPGNGRTFTFFGG